MSAYATQAREQLDSFVGEHMGDVLANPYLRALGDGTMTKDEFVASQIQFWYAVDYFSRPMATLAARLPDCAQRTAILRNVWEEHGEGRLALHHGHTFLEFLHRLDGVTLADVHARGIGPAAHMFNATLAGACSVDEVLVAIGAIGMIEGMFARISGFIGAAVVSRGWLSESQLIHYSLHETLDLRHADDFFSILAVDWPRERAAIERGIRLGAHSFDGLYRELHLR